MKLVYKNRSYVLNGTETVLDGLLRHGIEIPHACKSGVCQSCIMRVIEGSVPEKSQYNLKTTFRRNGLFLSCQCEPVTDMVISDANDLNIDVIGQILDYSLFTPNTLRLLVKTDAMFVCEPGQYVTLINQNNVARSYSVANNPKFDGYLEFHIRLIPNGKMGRWLQHDAKVGDSILIRGPMGNCFYTFDNNEISRAIILAGTGTGLAPLYGIVKEALRMEHKGKIQLFHGALNESGLYMVDELNNMQKNYINFSYVPCVLSEDTTTTCTIGNIEELVMQSILNLDKNTQLFICGDSALVNSLKIKAFIAGLMSKNIYSDSFIPSQK
jgi:NAD(P)H-flavin reductase/ferredoxin